MTRVRGAVVADAKSALGAVAEELVGLHRLDAHTAAANASWAPETGQRQNHQIVKS